MGNSEHTEESDSDPKSLQLKAILGAQGVKGKCVTALNKGYDLSNFMQTIALKKSKEPFYVLDLSVVQTLMSQWRKSLPGVRPFYAVKCNPEPALLGAMAALGSGFDCASRAEIESVLALGVSPDRIVFANPCKPESHVSFAAEKGVNLTTFDSIEELEKIRNSHKDCAVLLRIKPPEEGSARCPLGSKYGALQDEIEPLLEAARSARLVVRGVSFHVGSGAAHPQVYGAAIAESRRVFDIADRLGFPPMSVLNIGGGFTAGEQFEEAALNVRAALNKHFDDKLGSGALSLIAEPGRYFAESAFTLATNIIGKRVRGEGREYWINDGVYGSMNCLLYDHATLTCEPLSPTCEGETTYSSTVFGPTCDALDTVLTGHSLPELRVNDWLVFPNMGAYTMAAGSHFNGFDTSAILTYLAY